MVDKILNNKIKELYVNKGMTILETSKELKIGTKRVSEVLKKDDLIINPEEYNKTHGMSNTRQYRIWTQIKNRCNNPKNIKYDIYGGKGITYDDKWEKFEGFWADMKDGYLDGLTIDRIDNSKNYCKKNCRWASYTEQNYNKSDNVSLVFKGKNIKVKNLVKILPVALSTVYRHIGKNRDINWFINYYNLKEDDILNIL